MFMTYRVPTSAARPLLRAIVAVARTVSLCVGHFYGAFQHRRDIAVLADRDDRMLADIGLKRSDLRDARHEPLWRDPTTLLARRAGAARDAASRVMRWRPGHNSRRALAEVDDDHLSDLSELGRQIRREVRRERAVIRTNARHGARAARLP